MLTAAALVESGFDPASPTPVNPADIKPQSPRGERALYRDARQGAAPSPRRCTGSSPAEIARGKMQTLAVADEFPNVIKDLIAVGVKTHFIYYVVAKNNAYKQPLPDVLEDRPGQMDAFGIASGLVAIHTRRPDNSFMEFVQRDNPKSPFFTGFSKAERTPRRHAGHDRAGHARAGGRRRASSGTSPAWAPPVPAPIDVKSVNWATASLSRQLGRQPGRLVADAGLGRVGHRRSADGQRPDPRAAQPVHRQPAAAAVSVHERGSRRARRKARRCSRRDCANCHRPTNETIYPAAKLGVDPNRTLVNTSVSRYGLSALVMEACTIYGLNNKGKPGADWCVPQGDWQARLDEYFRDTPRRVAERTNGYKADMLHGIWAQAPYLHNGSVPTLGQLICSETRPRVSCAATSTTTNGWSASNGWSVRPHDTGRTRRCWSRSSTPRFRARRTPAIRSDRSCVPTLPASIRSATVARSKRRVLESPGRRAARLPEDVVVERRPHGHTRV